ncbi:NADH-ubiquinone oxidoreductase-F iron-sulfur binding region domain-containing protein [Chloroflexota bacterium]
MNFKKIKSEAVSDWERFKNKERIHILVGTSTCGRAAGALDVLDTLKQKIEQRGIDAEIAEVGCMGHCYAEPLMVVSKPGSPAIVYGYVTPGVASVLVDNCLLKDDPCLEFALGALEDNELIPTIYDMPRFEYEQRIVLRNCGDIDPMNINHYIANGGYATLESLFKMTQKGVIEQIKKSGLRGRGGGGYSTGQKWEITRKARGKSTYIICNADEGDPGAFMDRAVLEGDPHAVIEGMIIAAYAVGASQGYIYVRAEYPLAVQTVQHAIDQAADMGLLGRNILGSKFDFEMEVFRGSGAFVCGEETALIASIEGKRGMPHNRPPYPATKGLFGMPTLVSNVKTFATVPLIIERGADWYSSIGTEGSRGTAVFALAGKVVNTGLVEVPMGTTLRNVVYDVGGGVPNHKKFKAVQIGGPSGGCLPESALDIPVDFDSLTQAGAIFGSGGMVVLDEDNCMVEAARYFLDFTQKESCGKCTLCRLGTKHMLGMLEDIVHGNGKIEYLDMLTDLAADIEEGSLCGLGRTAPNPILTTLRYFHDEYTAHIVEKRCPALSCKDLIAYYILPDKCERSCDACVGICTAEAIFSGKKRIKVIDQDKCVKCDTCIAACPPEYSAIIKISPASDVPETEKRPEKK